MISPELFIMQADRICHEVFELFSENIFSKIEVKQFATEENETLGEDETGKNSLLVITSRDSLIKELEKNGEKFSISDSFICDNQLIFFVIYYKKQKRISRI